MIRFLLFALLVLAASPSAHAQDGADAQCRAALVANAEVLNVRADALPPRDECRALAGAIQTLFSYRRQLLSQTVGQRSVITPRAVQPGDAQTGGLAGSAAQSEAVPDARPVALAGGTVAALGTRDQAGAMTSISINPASFLVSGDPERVAEVSRMLDVSLVVPLASETQTPDTEGLDYVGVRLRYNLLGLAEGARVMRELEGAFSRLVSAEADEIQRLQALLETSSDAEACTAALVGLQTDADAECAADAVPATSADLYTSFARTVEAARREADAAYFGADLRLDVGDPTLGATPGARGVSWLAGLAGGKRFGEGAGAAEVRGRLGVYFARRDSMTQNRFAADGALGVQVQRPYAFQHLTASVGLEGRWGTTPETTADLGEAERDFLLLRGSVNVPLSDVYSASVALALPLLGENLGPVLSIGGNWQLLWPGGSPRP